MVRLKEVFFLRDESLLRDLTQLWGVSGYEKEVRRFIEKEAVPLFALAGEVVFEEIFLNR